MSKKKYMLVTVDKFSGFAILEPKKFDDLYEAREVATNIEKSNPWGITWIYNMDKDKNQIMEVYQ